MSVDLLRSRLTDDLTDKISIYAEALVGQSQAPLDVMRYNQGMIAGLRAARDLLDERYKNLHAIG